MPTSLIPERLKNAREKLGISKAEASRRLNMSKIGYCRYEYGDRAPSIQTIEIIAQCFDTSVSYLIGDTDDISPDLIIIKKDENPILFEIAKDFSSNNEMQKRLWAYCQKIMQQRNAISKDN